MSKFSWLPGCFLALALAAPAMAQPAPAPASGAPQTPPVSPSAAASQKTQPVDINSATATDLRALPGITDSDAAKIIQGRPYADTHQLVTKKVLSESTYDKIKTQVAVKQPKS